MEKRITIDHLEYDLSHEEKMTFQEANLLCVDGWRIPTIEELAKLGEKYYVKGNKVKLGGRNFSPKLYWTPGASKSHRGGEIDRNAEYSTLFYFDLNCGWFISGHNAKQNVILVKNI
jgi:hypothetical protein